MEDQKCYSCGVECEVFDGTTESGPFHACNCERWAPYQCLVCDRKLPKYYDPSDWPDDSKEICENCILEECFD